MILTSKSLELDTGRVTVKTGKREIKLTRATFRYLQALMEANGRVLSDDQLQEYYHGEPADRSPACAKVHICALRRALGYKLRRLVENVRGFGFKYTEEVERKEDV